MNPVYLKPTIEVMKGFHTSEETIALTKDFLSQIGKNAIVVNDFPGFVFPAVGLHWSLAH